MAKIYHIPVNSLMKLLCAQCMERLMLSLCASIRNMKLDVNLCPTCEAKVNAEPQDALASGSATIN